MAMPGPGLLVVVTALLVGTATVGDSRHRGDGEHCCKNEGDEFQGSRPVGDGMADFNRAGRSGMSRWSASTTASGSLP